MKINLYINCLFISIVILTSGCHSSSNKKNIYDWNNGSVVIMADSNLKNILEPLIPIYENFYPKASVQFQYTTEDDALKGFLNNKYTIVAMEKQFTDAETQQATQVQDAKIMENIFAYDAIAVIANKSFKDSVFTVEKMNDFLQPSSPIKLVFDNTKSGIAKKLLQLSAIPADVFKNAYSLNSITEVLKYISTNTNAIGFIPYNILSDRNEEEAKKIRNGFKFLSVSYKNKTTALSQENIATQTYPLIRPVVLYIGNCPDYVGQGFANFLFSRQVSKALLLNGLVPKSIPVREVQVTESFNPSK